MTTLQILGLFLAHFGYFNMVFKNKNRGVFFAMIGNSISFYLNLQADYVFLAISSSLFFIYGFFHFFKIFLHRLKNIKKNIKKNTHQKPL